MMQILGEKEEMPRTIKIYGYIRFSKDEQSKGHSATRQTEKIREFAASRGLAEPDVETYRDLGTSAFTDANVAKGSGLGKFLKDISEGTVGRGDWLIVENLDRLSRRPITETLNLLTQITNAGVSVATVHDNSVFEFGKFDLIAVVRAAVAADIANRSSADKSDRVGRAWAAKRDRIKAGFKLTAKCPGWLSVASDGKSFVVDKERADLVKRMFRLTCEGRGNGFIANAFNAEKQPNWKKDGAGWSRTAVFGVLRSRAVIGEFTPCKMVNGKRVPVGEPITDYFPRIISDEEFYAAEEVMKSRRNSGGRAVTSGRNLFTKLTFCGNCGGPVHIVSKSATGVYLRCDRSARKLTECKPNAVRYALVEKQLVRWLVDFDFTGATRTEREQKQGEMEAALAIAKEAVRTINRLTEAMKASTEPVMVFVPEIEKAQRKQEEAKSSAKRLFAELATLQEDVLPKDILDASKNPENRHRLREGIRKRVKKIFLRFGGWRGTPKDAWFEQPCLRVERNDGGEMLIYGDEEVRWFENGHRFEYEGGRKLTDTDPNDPENAPVDGFKPKTIGDEKHKRNSSR